MEGQPLVPRYRDISYQSIARDTFAVARLTSQKQSPRSRKVQADCPQAIEGVRASKLTLNLNWDGPIDSLILQNPTQGT